MAHNGRVFPDNPKYCECGCGGIVKRKLSRYLVGHAPVVKPAHNHSWRNKGTLSRKPIHDAQE